MLIGRVWISPPMVSEIAEITGVHRTTVARWLERKTIPEAIYQLLDLLQNGQIGRINDAWEGFGIDRQNGELITPVGTTIRPGEIMAIAMR